MQIREIILYGRNGETRSLGFKPGALNIVTGDSATGKSALLSIVDFCLGRDTWTIPAGPITDSVAWYAVLLDVGDTRVFLARPSQQSASTSRAMLEIGTNMGQLPRSSLTENADSATLRDELSRLIGIDENEVGDQTRGAGLFTANVGHASLLCFQRQDEIANSRYLFHRQGESGIGQAIQDTLPYFLGALPSDLAVRRQELHAIRAS